MNQFDKKLKEQRLTLRRGGLQTLLSWCRRRQVLVSFILFLMETVMASARAEVVSVPLARTNGWQFLKYRKIEANTFRGTPSGLEIGVTNSAAPAIFPLATGLDVIELRVSGRITGSLRVPPDKQG